MRLRLCLVKEIIEKIKKSKSEIKRDLEESIVNGKRNKNADMQLKVNVCITSEDALKVIQELEQIIKNKKSDIVWLAYYQGQIFQKFKEKESFLSMFLKLTIIFKIALKNVIDDYPKIKDPLRSLHYFLKNLKLIKEIWEESVSEFK